MSTWPLLQALIAMLRPRRIIAIGRDAYLALDEIGVPASAVRHPSYGGQREFIAGMFAIYGVDDDGLDDEAPELPILSLQAAAGSAAFA